MNSRTQQWRKLEAQALEVLKREGRELKAGEVAKLGGLSIQQAAHTLKRLAANYVVRIREVEEVHARSRVVPYKMYRWVGECQAGVMLRPLPRALPPGVARVVRGRDTRR